MPALAPLFHEGGILRAARDRHGHVAGDADVAADAFADVLDAALLDFLRQERIGDRGPCAADEIERAGLDHLDHHVGRGEAPYPDDRFGGELPDAGHQAFLRGFVLEAGRTGTILPRTVREIPEVGQIGVHLDHVADLGIGETEFTDHLVQREPQRQPAGVADGVTPFLDQLAHEARTVLQRAAILVATLVGSRRQEVLDDAEAVGAIKADEIEAGQPGTLEGIAMPATQIANVLLVHGTRLHRIIGEGADRQGSRSARHLARVEVRPVDAGIGQLDTGQRAMRAHRGSHFRERRDILVFPQPQLDERRDFRGVVHLGLFGKDDAPAAFRFRAPHLGRCRRVAIATAIAMRNLIETVLRGDRADLHRLEQNVVAGIAHELSSGGWHRALAMLPPIHRGTAATQN